MKFFIVFALVAAASASPVGLGSWQLTDNGWQFLPLANKGLITTPAAPTEASTTVASTEAVTSPSTEAVTTPSTTSAITESTTISTTVALSEGVTSPLSVDEITTTTITSTSANTVGRDDSGDSTSTTLEATTSVPVINIGTVNVISSRLDSATVPTIQNETSTSLGNDIEGSASQLNATAPTTTPVASSTPIKFGNDVDGSATTLDATNSPSTVSFKLGNNTINVNSSAPTINIDTININNELDGNSTILNSTTSNFKLGNDLDGTPSTFNDTTPAKLSSDSEDVKTTTPSINIGTININNRNGLNDSMHMADSNVTTPSTITPSTMKLGNDMDGATPKTINIDSTIPTINIGTVNVNNNASMADSNVNISSTVTPSPMKLGNDIDSTPTALNSAPGKTINVNSTIPTINIDTVNVNNAMDSNATALNSTSNADFKLGNDLNATTIAPSSAMKLGNDMDGTTSALNATTTPASSPLKLGENRDGVHPMKKTVLTTTVASDVKVLKPNTCIISEHASDHADCRRRADGDFFRNTQDCRMYYRCAHGLRMQCACPLGTVFSQLTTVCDYEWAVPECNADPQDWQPQLATTTETEEMTDM